MILDPNLLAEALKGSKLSEATLLTAGSKEELLGKLSEMLGEQEEDDRESERLTNVALTMTPEKASNLAAAALLGAGQEFERGHQDCARLKIDAADTWVALGNLLLAVAERNELLEARAVQQAEFQRSFDRNWTPEQKAAEEVAKAKADADRLSEEALVTDPGSGIEH